MLNTIAFIGAGVMAEAMIQGLLKRQLIAPEKITASGPREKRRAELAARFGIHTVAANAEAARAGDIVVLAIKPQVLPRVLRELKGTLRADQMLISIIAGGRIATIGQGLGHAAVVRAMPNTPAQIGEGLTVWTATSTVTDAQREQTREIFQAL